MKKSNAGTTDAPFAFGGLDRVMHEKARLGLLSSLIPHPKGLTFSELKQLCGLSDGNLSQHLQILQEAKLVKIEKMVEGSRPQTVCYLTRDGRRRFLDYLALLEKLVKDAAKTAGEDFISARAKAT